jgi:RNA polymerase sigma factor (sigma-70 family)
MRDLEQSTKDVIDRFSALIRQVIQRNLHRGDDIDLEDIEQEVRLKIWSFLKKGKKVDNFPSYIKRVAYSTTIDELRKMMKQRPSGQPENLKRIFAGAHLVSGASGDFSPEVRLDDSEVRESVQNMVGSLSEGRRTVLELYLKGLTIDEISASLNWDKPRVRHLFYRGIDDLKERSRNRIRNGATGTAPGWPGGAKS